MSEISLKREIELLTLRLLALTAENEMLVRNAISKSNDQNQLKATQDNYKNSSQELSLLNARYTVLLEEYEELQKHCEKLQTQLNTANEKYRIVTSQVNAYKEQLKVMEYSSISGKLKYAAKKVLNKNSGSEGENK